MKKIAIIILLIFLIKTLPAQNYRTGIGLRGGLFSGISVKHFYSGLDAVEGVIAFHHRGLLLAGMYQRHTMAFDVPALNWYYGFGAHFGYYERRHTPWFSSARRGTFTTLGILGVIGLEYVIDEIPFSIGVDFTPALNIVGHTGLWPGAGITLRYTIR